MSEMVLNVSKRDLVCFVTAGTTTSRSGLIQRVLKSPLTCGRKRKISFDIKKEGEKGRKATHLPSYSLIHRRRRRVTENVLEFRPPPGARTKVVREGDHDPVGGDVRSGGDAGLGVTDRVGELLEGVLLEVVVIATLRRREMSAGCSRREERRRTKTNLEVGHNDKISLVNGRRPVLERLDKVVVPHKRQRRLVDIVARRTLHVIVDRVGETNNVTLRELVEAEVEGVLGTGKDEGVPGDRFDALGERLRRDVGGRRRVRLEIGVGNGGEGTKRSRPAATAASALALLRS